MSMKIDFLKLILATAICESLSDPKSSEPQRVANLVYFIPNFFNSFFGTFQLPSGSKISCGGIFVHQSPYITYADKSGNSVTIEIGDLLVVKTHRHANGMETRSSLLLQAKRFKKKLPKLPRPRKQHYFYEKWPNFSYTNLQPSTPGNTRKVTGAPNILYQGAKYLFLKDAKPQPLLTQFLRCNQSQSNHLCDDDVVSTANPTPIRLSTYQCFICELRDLILGNAGRLFSYPPPSGNIDWDQVMADLIDNTWANPSNPILKASSNRSGARQQGNFFLTGDPGAISSRAIPKAASKFFISDFESGPPQVPDDISESPESGGISIIEFFVDEIEREIEG
jgi:hypothetical protein